MTCVMRLRLPVVRSVARWVPTRNTWTSRKSTWLKWSRLRKLWGSLLSSVRGRDLAWVLSRMVRRSLRSVGIPVGSRRAPR